MRVQSHRSVRDPIGLAGLVISISFPALGQWVARDMAGRPVTALAVDPATPATLYAGTALAGIWKSVDSGATWSLASSGYTGDSASAIAIDPALPSTLYVGSNAGVFKSTNGAASWSLASSGLANTQVYALVLDPGNPATLYVAVNTVGSIYRSTNGADGWSPRPLPIPSGSAATLAIRGSEVFAGWANVLFRSTDGGGSWPIQLPDNLPNTHQALAPVPGSADVLVGLAQFGVYRHVVSPVPDWIASSTGLLSRRISALAISPADPASVFAASNGGGVFHSQDGGTSWEPVLEGLSSTDVTCLAFDPAGERLYAGTSNGVFLLNVADLVSPRPASRCETRNVPIR